jgi:hypothetical protein
MAHCNVNFKTKKALKEAVAAGRKIGIHNPSGMFEEPDNGTAVVEMPWEFHRSYAQVTLEDGVIVKVK